MGERRKARELAMQRLYSHLIAPPQDDAEWNSLSGEARDFARRLVDGTTKHSGQIDKYIAEASTNWRTDRMAAVDRSILRMAIYEFLFEDEIPYKVTINEAVDIAKKFGSDKSGSFVNGILDNIAKSLPKKGEG